MVTEQKNINPAENNPSSQKLKTDEKIWQDAIGNELIEKSYQCEGTRLVYEKQFERIISTMNVGTGDSILEIGCGRGQLLNAIAERFEAKKVQLFGLDLSSRLNEVKEKYSKNLNWITADGENLPFSNQSLDIVVYNGSLHHMPDYEKALKEAFRIIKENGHVIMYEPESTFFSRTVHALLDPFVFKKVTYESPVDIYCKNSFKFSDLNLIITNSGFLFKKSRYDFLAYPLTGCYSNSFFSQKPRFMKFLIFIEEKLNNIPGFGKLFNFFSWRLLMDIYRRPS